ncbi:MAG: phosphoribosylanthranilate isomerase, partial [Desulfobacteraceae bacterium]
MPAAVDVSSGVEASPGIKDLAKVESFIKTVKQSPSATPLEKIF